VQGGFRTNEGENNCDQIEESSFYLVRIVKEVTKETREVENQWPRQK
jgi:hypothetical protein